MLGRLGLRAGGLPFGGSCTGDFRAEPRRFDAVLSDQTMPRLISSEPTRSMNRIRLDSPIVLMSAR